MEVLPSSWAVCVCETQILKQEYFFYFNLGLEKWFRWKSA